MKKIIIIGAGGHAAELRDYMDILNCHRSAQSLTANGQVQVAPVQFDQCAAFASVCKN